MPADKHNKPIVIDFIKSVASFIAKEKLEASLQLKLEEAVKGGYTALENEEFSSAFTQLAEALINNHVVLYKEGIALAKQVIKVFKLDTNWAYRLQGIRSPGYVPGSWVLANAAQIAKEHPYTFYKPSLKITNQLKKGDIAKVIFEFESVNPDHPTAERMWVLISKIEKDSFTGELDNHPYYIHELFAGDTITFQHKHIIAHSLDITEPNLVDKYIDRCFVSHRVLYENVPIGFLYKEEPEILNNRQYKDSGWRILSGDESETYLDNPENSSFVSLGAVLAIDDAIIELLDSKIGSEFIRGEDGRFQLVKP